MEGLFYGGKTVARYCLHGLKWNLLFLWLVGLALFAGVAIDFIPEMIWHDQQRIEQLVLLVAVSLAVATVRRKKLLVSLACLSGLSRIALGSAFVLGGVSAIVSALPRFAGLEWVTILLLFTLTLVLAVEGFHQRARYDVWAMRLVVTLAVVVAMKVMMGYVASIVGGLRLDSLAMFEGTFSNRRVFGQVASLVIPLLAYPFLIGGMSKFTRFSLFILLVLWWMLVIVSGTRGAWMALGFSAVVMAGVSWRASARWLKIQVLTFSMGALLFGLLFIWLPSWIGVDALIENRLGDFAALSGREVLWELAWAQIQAHPWLGIGPMQLAALRNDYGAHPHNAVLQLAAEWGIPAALALLLPLGYGLLRMLVRLRHQAERAGGLLVCLSGSLLAAGAQSMVDGVIVIPYTQTLLVFVAGWALGVYFRDVALRPEITDSRVWQLGVPALSMFAVIALLNGIFPEILNRAEVTQAYVDAGHSLIPPRYWGVGWIP
ncbi:MAG TPA: O-antigen ligase family protein [Thiobacillus sp.]